MPNPVINPAAGRFPIEKLPEHIRDRVIENLPDVVNPLSGSALFFQAYTEENGLELYRVASGSTTPTLIDINLGTESSDPFNLAAVGTDLFFTAYTEENGYELYRLAAGSTTPTLIDINLGTESSFAAASSGVGTDVFINAETEENGRELYRLAPGSTTPTLIDINLVA
jgi:ELWxxDGT repeat protein